ncbi:hypothetical protein [Pseudomonas sp. NY15374]|uniref:hypothetical protein n=1 Tax=Pseudomonas sp. NY15374 TaxID=3400357 RepID=UPI003A83B25C
MPMLEEFKKLSLDFIKKILLPDFSNKLTWLVVGTGTTILLTPDTASVIIANWLIDTLNLNFVSKFSLAELQNSDKDKFYGALLILGGLAHNLLANGVTKYLTHKGNLAESKKLAKQYEESAKRAERQRVVDQELLRKFLSDLPSNGRSLTFLRDHDLGSSFNQTYVDEIELFVLNWNCAEKKFLNEELEGKRQALWEVLNRFNTKLAMSAYDLNGGPMYSCIPDQFRGRVWPPYVDSKIKELNALSAQCYHLYNEFVMLARRSLQA